MRLKSSSKLNILLKEILIANGDGTQLSVHWKGKEQHLETFGLHDQRLVKLYHSGVV